MKQLRNQSVMRPAWGRSAGVQHDMCRGQGSEELGWVLAKFLDPFFFMMRKSGGGTGSHEEGIGFVLRLTLASAHVHVRVSAALVCPASPQCLSGTLRGGWERAAQEESYLKQRLWSEASQSVYQARSIPDTLAPSLTPAFASTVGTAALDCCAGPCLLLCVFALRRANAQQPSQQLLLALILTQMLLDQTQMLFRPQSWQRGWFRHSQRWAVRHYLTDTIYSSIQPIDFTAFIKPWLAMVL